MITIIDIGDNVRSISNMLKRVGLKSKISSDANDIEIADRLILPGVGAFDSGMKEILRREKAENHLLEGASTMVSRIHLHRLQTGFG